MTPLVLSAFTATSCIGRGLHATLATLRAARSGLTPCAFETVTLDTYVGEVTGVDDTRLPARLDEEFECRNNRLAWLGLLQDGFAEAVAAAATRYGAARVGVFLGTSTSGILDSEIAYRQRDPVSGALPATFRYRGAHNTFSVAAFARRALKLKVRRWSSPPPAPRAARCSPPRSARSLQASSTRPSSAAWTRCASRRSMAFMRCSWCRRRPAGLSIWRATASPSARPRPSRCSSAPPGVWMPMRCSCSAPESPATPTTCPPRTRRGAARARPWSRRSRAASLAASRHRLHQLPRHRHAEQRRGRGACRGRSSRPRRPGQLDQGGDRSHARRRRRARGGHLRTRAARGFHARRGQHPHDRSGARGQLPAREPQRSRSHAS